jgi:phage-related tail fiber protein
MPNKKISELTDAGTISTSDEIPLARGGRTYKAKIGLSIVPAGCVMAFAGTTIPEGWLLCDGSDIPNANGTVQGKTANFSTLFSIVGGNVPDLRGVFIRGVDNNRGVDSGRGIRSYQEAYAGYNKYSSSTDDGDNQANGGDRRGEMQTLFVNDTQVGFGNKGSGAQKNYGPYTIHNQAGDTRPKNVALHYIIKY